ncbi:MAG: dTMP kinase [Deltaproteobacteria bacterium]|nr:dTMP kinase [Deltaproteobacteria bacterium]MBI3075415.1 dTMP kinase [Deltaproteobacteria bacterium]
MGQGILIAIEGIDGSGKSTQADLLTRALVREGYPVVKLKEPTSGRWGQRIREIVQGGRGDLRPQAELELFVQDRYEDVQERILPALEQDHIVVMDRYYFSTMAYQGALGLDPRAIQRVNEEFAPRPDLVFILHLPPSVAVQRITRSRGTGNDAFEQERYLAAVEAIYTDLREPSIHHLDALQPAEEVHREIWRVVEASLQPFLREP